MNKKKKSKVLFICKYNRFRSKIAEAYYKKLYPGSPVRSRGLIQGKMNRNEKEIYLPKKLGLDIVNKPNGVHYADLEWADVIVITADNVPAKIFKSKRISPKIIQWNLPDIYPDTSDEEIHERVLEVIKKVDKLKVD